MNRLDSNQTQYAEHHWQSAPEQVWQDIQRQLNTETGDSDRASQRWPRRLAMAASLCIAAGLILMLAFKPDRSHAAAIERWQGYNHKLSRQIDSLAASESMYRADDLLITRTLQQQIDLIDQTLSVVTRDVDRLALVQYRAAAQLDLLNLQARASADNLVGLMIEPATSAEPLDGPYYEF